MCLNTRCFFTSFPSAPNYLKKNIKIIQYMNNKKKNEKKVKEIKEESNGKRDKKE